MFKLTEEQKIKLENSLDYYSNILKKEFPRKESDDFRQDLMEQVLIKKEKYDNRSSPFTFLNNTIKWSYIAIRRKEREAKFRLKIINFSSVEGGMRYDSETDKFDIEMFLPAFDQDPLKDLLIKDLRSELRRIDSTISRMFILLLDEGMAPKNVRKHLRISYNEFTANIKFIRSLLREYSIL